HCTDRRSTWPESAVARGPCGQGPAVVADARLVWLNESAVSTPLKLLRLDVYWTPRWIGNSNGIFARCLWERTPGAPPTWTPHHILVPLFSSSSLLKYFACILLICAV